MIASILVSQRHQNDHQTPKDMGDLDAHGPPDHGSELRAFVKDAGSNLATAPQ
jgi:hypothetical protein